MVHPTSKKIKQASLYELTQRVLAQADVGALTALCRKLADVILEMDRNPKRPEGKRRKLDFFEMNALYSLRNLPLKPLLPPGPSIPLSRMEAQLLGLLQAVGDDGIDKSDVLQQLHISENYLRKLIHQTNRKLSDHDPNRQRICRIRKTKIFLKMLPKQ